MTTARDSDASSGDSPGRGSRAPGAAGEVEGAPVGRTTLPPPEWTSPRSVSGLALEWLARHVPVSRRRGPRSELGVLRAKLTEAANAGDSDAERAAATALSRALAVRGMELDLATKLARRALMLGEDAGLREELSSWFAALGEPGLAAATLRPLVESETGQRLARLLTRIAVFLGRNGDARGAAEALLEAGAADSADPVPEELRGAIAAWAPEAVSLSDSSEAYLDAARRREAKGEKAAAFEDLLRAFEIAPDHAPAAEWLARHLAAHGREGAADEVLREHARASGSRAASVHRARLREAVADGSSARALCAAFDAGLDRAFDPGSIAHAASAEDSGADLVTFDRLLSDVGLHEIVAARFELAAEALTGTERARARIAQGKVAGGPIGSADRAAEAWIDALVADPSNETTKALLRQHAANYGDPGPLVEALVRVATSPRAEGEPERAACLRELVVLADQRLADPALSLWAVRRLMEGDQRDDELRSIASRLAARARLQDEAFASTRVQLEAARGAARLELLRIAAVALRGRPDEAGEYVRVLEELVRHAPDERVWRQLLEKVLARARRFDALEALFKEDLQRKLPKVQHERARLGLSAILRQRDDVNGAIAVLEPLIEDGAMHRAGWAMLFVLATNHGRESLRAEALAKTATLFDASLEGLLASIASDIHLSVSDRAAARRAAEQACHADRSAPRSIAALARATEHDRDRLASVALERAAGVIVPRASQCRILAETFDALGDPAASLAWTQRWLALRPGDRAAATALVSAVMSAAEPGRIADAFAWLLSQPEPLTNIIPLLSNALPKLADVDPGRAAALARRALDVFGPRATELSGAVLTVSDRIGDRALGISVIERKLASGAPGTDRAALLLELARRRRHAGDADIALRTLVRALSEGADAAGVLAELDVALPPKSSDGELAILEGRCEALSALSLADLEGTARAWREYGAALWDLADDKDGAIAAWERACALGGEDGAEKFARDLVSFAGHAEAVRRLEDLATRRRNRADAARALAAAAAVALDGGLRAEALGIAIRALEADSSRADVLGIAERSASELEIAELERAYEIVSRGSLGIYGERATHYRAARQLEKRGFRELALRHAIRAFEAVPAEGVAFVLMMRLAERTGDPADAISAIERVASGSKSAEERAAWLRRAALVAGSGADGKRQRVEVLLRALDANPHAETLRSLGAALTELVRAIPDDRDIAEMRFAHALRSMLPRLDGPDGARVAVEAAETALGTFSSAELALTALRRAIDADGSIDEYRALTGSAAALGAVGERTAEFIAKVAENLRSPYASTGPALVDLAEAVAAGTSDARLRADLVVARALTEPENVTLLRRAEVAARAANDADLLQSVLAAVPVEERVRSLEERGDAAAADGALSDAILAFEELRQLERAPKEAKTAAERRLVALYGEARRFDALEALLREGVASDDAEMRTRSSRELATLLFELDRADEGFPLFEPLLEREPTNADLWLEFSNHARRVDDVPRQIRALSRLAELEEDPPKKLPLLQRLAPLLVSEGEGAAALARFKEILAIDERDTTALTALEQDAERRADWEALADLCSRRAALAKSVEDVRRIRLRRAEVLESKLGRPEDARAELEALLAEKGDSLPVLTALADLNERAGAKLRAAPLWLRASAIPKDANEAAELSRRACQAYLDGGDAPSARRVFQGMTDQPRTASLVALRVDIERRGEDPLALSEALEEMALSSMDPPPTRAALLVEAARAALSAGRAQTALGQAQRAARIATDSAEPQLFARLLEYRQRGPGSREEASTTIRELRTIHGPLEPRERELAAFLLAEAQDVANGAGEGMRELARVHAELGALPLIALGMAERLAAGSEPERALGFFDSALDGDLRELRRRGQVALAAGRAAERANKPDRALDYYEIAASMPETRADALGAQTVLRAALGRVSDAPPLPSSSENDAVMSEIPSSPRVPSGVGLPQPSAPEPAHAEERPEVSIVAPPSSTVPSTLRASAPPKPASRRPAATFDLMAATAVPSRPIVEVVEMPPPPLVTARQSSGAPAPSTPREFRGAPGDATVPGSTGDAPPSPPRFGSPTPLGTRAPTFAGATANEQALLLALSRGSIQAGKDLVEELEKRPDRSHDLVNACRRIAHFLPGDRWVLEKLYEATLADRNIVYARAVEHVLRAFDPKAARLEPPPLGEQIEQPDRVHAVLFRDTACPATEALGLVWSGASHMFRRDPASYGVTGLERVAPGGPTALARLFGGASRLLGMTRTPLFQRRSGEPVTLNVALLSPPALVLTGEVKTETTSLAYHLGAMLAATLPEHVLLYGAPEAQVRNVMRALLAAFGPPSSERQSLASIATLAEMLWESIPARSQRRLRELCSDTSRVDYGLALAAARQAVRRAGLFVSGDITVAIREACADLGVSTWGLDAPGGLEALCSSSPAIADLVRLATSLEYASARWQQIRGGGRHSSG